VFRFGKWWLEMKDFEELVKKEWDFKCPLSEPVNIWQFNIRTLRKKVKGRSRNIEAERKKRKTKVMGEIDGLDTLGEHNTPLLSNRRQELKRELEHIWQIGKIRARQKARDRDIKEGDKDTSYFFALANQRKRKKCISSLVD
jgi:hypothetical protein